MDPSPDNRHARHLTLPQVGAAGQRAIETSRVLIVGLGGLGSPAALYLAGAGVGRREPGRLVLADFDVVELSNLQRQIAHTTGRAGQLKTHSAREACLAIDPDLAIDTVDHGLDEEDLAERVPDMDLVLDCSDNFATRFAINAACVRAGVPLVIGAAIRFDGQIMTVDPRCADTPCYRCLYEDAEGSTGQDDTCAQAGILGPVVGLVGCLQALEALKLLCGAGTSLAGRLMLIDGLSTSVNEIVVAPRPGCRVCATRPALYRAPERPDGA